jgi:hypothetical protein
VYTLNIYGTRQMKPGDLVQRAAQPGHHYGVGLVVKFLFDDDDGDSRWAVLWTNPLWTLKDGTSVTYESELKVINEK